MKESLQIQSVIQSKDSITRKYIQSTEDRYNIETVYVDYPNKHIICISTQIGCKLACKFCYNGIRRKYRRNLTSAEIINQVRNIVEAENPDTSTKPILISAMGVGEPLLNYNNVIKSFKEISKEYPDSRFALATTGVCLDNIIRLAKDLKGIDFKLTISLHSARQEIRDKLMPTGININILVDTVKEYERLTGRKVDWNYVLFKDINDSQEDVTALHNLLGESEQIKINRYNPVDISTLTESRRKEVFIEELKKQGMQVECYSTNGSDIKGACGQLV